MSKIADFPPTDTFTPELALKSALDMAEAGLLKDVIVMGWDNEGALLVRSSRMSCKDSLWLAEALRSYILYSGGLIS